MFWWFWLDCDDFWCLSIPALTTQVKTADLDPSRSYLLGSHPHGVLCSGAVSAFATEGIFKTQKIKSRFLDRTWLEGIIPWSWVPPPHSYDPVLHSWTPRTCLLVCLFVTKTRVKWFVQIENSDMHLLFCPIKKTCIFWFVYIFVRNVYIYVWGIPDKLFPKSRCSSLLMGWHHYHSSRILRNRFS